MSALRALLSGIIDYAGLFPPAALPMPQAVQSYAAAQRGPHGWMLGRFVVPCARLAECAAAIAHLSGSARPGSPVALSVLLGPDLEDDLRSVEAFNADSPAFAPAIVDTIECRASLPADITAAGSILPRGMTAFVEIPLEGDLRARVRAIAQAGLRAKVRTGGTTAAAFPDARLLARFVRECVAAGVEFKATAGLHHPVRGRYPLTYDSGSELATMYGFLNLLSAVAVAAGGGSEAEVRAMLELEGPRAVRLAGDALLTGDRSFGPEVLAGIRSLLISFGSCSFEEPVHELREITLA